MTELTKTLDFQLQVTSDNTTVLENALSKARTVYNKTLHYYFNTNQEYKKIRTQVESEVNLIKNTIQLIADKTYECIQNYYNIDSYNRPKQKPDTKYPLRSNYNEGYTLTVKNNTIHCQISSIPYGEKVQAILNGSEEHANLLKNALQDTNWRVGVSEVLKQNGVWKLHVTVTKTNAKVRSPSDSKTLIGVDINESNVSLAAVTSNGVSDSIVFEYNAVKEKRHELYTSRKRLQENDKSSQLCKIGNKEERFVTDVMHKLSRHIVEWVNQFEKPCIVFEDLKDMRDSINYGSQLNRRLHALPFGLIQTYITYKANFDEIPVVKIDPAYTSQECLQCGHTSRSNRNKKRFKCVECGFQDHSDRKASVSIAERGVSKIGFDWMLLSLNKLPVVRTVGCDGLASGGLEPPTTA